MLELNKIYNMECVQGMKLLDDCSVDLTVTSPPYDNLRSYKGFEFDFESVAKELYRVTKQGGVVVWIVGDATVKGSETGTSFKQALYFKEIGFNLHDTMIYAKNGGLPINCQRYNPSFEYMFIFTKGKVKTFNPLLIECRQAGKTSTGTQRQKNGTLKIKTGYGKPTKNNKTKDNVWIYEIGFNKTTKDKIAFQHPAIFPEQLAQDHITSWSNENDLVLDCFMGSGTIAKMAKANNRQYIGFELSEEYCQIAEQRLRT